MKKSVLIVLLIILVVAGAMLLKKRRQTIAEAPSATPITYTVRTVLAETRTIFQTSTFLAMLEAESSVGISSKLSGRVSELLVHESQKVRQGDLLVRIDDKEILTAIDALRARLVSARKQSDYSKALHERNRALFKAGGLAREKLEASEVAGSAAVAAVEDLEQRIKGLESQLDYLNIRAPFAGIVGTLFLHQGDLASPGRSIISLNSLPQKLTFSFMPGPEEIQPGQDVLLWGVKAGEITRLYNDARGGLAVAEVALDRQLDRPVGSYLTIEVVTKVATGCAIPVQALLHRQKTESIMLYQEGRFEEKPVTVRAQDKEFAMVDPCVTFPVAVASEAKLSLLPTYGRIRVLTGANNG